MTWIDRRVFPESELSDTVWKITYVVIRSPGYHLPTTVGDLAAIQALYAQRQSAAALDRPLSLFFPYDPYLLSRSARFLRLDETYVVWKGGHPGTGHREFSDDSSSESDVDSDSSDSPSSGSDEEEEDDSGTDELGKSVEVRRNITLS